MLTMLLLFCFEQKPAKLPLPIRPAGFKELVGEASFVSNFHFDKVLTNSALPEQNSDLAELRTKRDLFQNVRSKELPIPIPVRIYSLQELEPRYSFVISPSYEVSYELPYMPWIVPLLQRDLFTNQAIGIHKWVAWRLDRSVHYVITKEPSQSSPDYVGALARFSFIRARGKSVNEVEEKLIQQYRLLLEEEGDIYFIPRYRPTAFSGSVPDELTAGVEFIF